MTTWAAAGYAPALVDTESYGEISRYLALHRDQVAVALRTLSSVDVASLARRATAARRQVVGVSARTGMVRVVLRW